MDFNLNVHHFHPVPFFVGFSWRLYYVYGDKSQIAAKKASPEDIRVVATEIELIIQSQGGVYVLLLTGVSDRVNFDFVFC